MPTLKQVEGQLSAIRHSFDAFQSFIESFDKRSGDVQLLQIKTQTLEEKYARAQSLLQELAGLQKTHDFDLQDTLDEQYCSLKLQLTKLLPSKPAPSDVPQNKYPSTAAAKLPKVQLQTFDGTPENWLPYFQLFSALVHDQPDIPKVIKFQHLKGSLSTEPLKIVNQLPLTAENYDEAIQMLDKRYNNPRLNILRYIRCLRELPKMTSESPSTLKIIFDKFATTVKILQGMECPVEDYLSNILVCEMILEKLDKRTQELYEATASLYTVDELHDFLQKRVEILESLTREPIKPKPIINSFTPKFTPTKSAQKFHNPAKTLLATEFNCAFCNGNHLHYQCDNFLKCTPTERLQKVKQHQLCSNCLKPNHSPMHCKSFRVCRICNKKHHSLLHIDESASTSTNQPLPIQPQPQPQLGNKKPNSVALISNSFSQVLLPTAVIVVSTNDSYYEARTLLDSCSNTNYITSSCAKLLNLNCTVDETTINGIAGTQSIACYSTQVEIGGKNTNFSATISATVIDEITTVIPSYPVSKTATDWILNQNLRLADESFMTPNKVDMLLGAELFFKLLKNNQITVPDSELRLIDTYFGWVVSGTDINTPKRKSVNSFLSIQLQKFWELEEVPKKPVFTDEENFCEEYFTKTTERMSDGRFVVRLPFKQHPSLLGNSEKIARYRLNSMRQKMSKNPSFKHEYQNFMTDYENSGHMSPIECASTDSYYLPHHAVEKADSTTTKLRVVFDGTAEPENGSALNEILAVGPTIQSNLFEIVVRFRTHFIALVADVAQMYRQILVHPDERKYQSILWNNKTYQLNTVTYGTASAPFLATRALKKIADETVETDPIVSMALAKDTYVDDIVTGADDIETAIRMQTGLRTALKASGFHLRKWSSNIIDSLQGIPAEDIEKTSAINFKFDDAIKTLGITWKRDEDAFVLSFSPLETRNQISKRIILSDISTVFDPLGLCAPIVVQGKILVQRIWKLQVDWDDPIDDETIIHDFQMVCQNFNDILNLSIPRCITLPFGELELHGFSDASENAYAAVIYLRCQSNGTFISNLLCAKTKLAPTKTQLSIPKLELCGAHLLAELITKVNEILTVTKITLWTDSTIVLNWLQKLPRDLITFIGNRVADIQQWTSNFTWKHISGKNNPADIPTRYILTTELQSNQLWWHGPSFLQSCESSWPNPKVTTLKDLPGIKPTKRPINSLVASDNPFNPFTISSYPKLIRVYAYVLRFYNNAKNSTNRNTSSLTCDELNRSRMCLIRIVQLREFSDEFRALSSKRQISRSSRLKSLDPRLDDDQLIRVGGRLEHAPIVESLKHPIILPAKHQFTISLIWYLHQKYLHAGSEFILNQLRSQYWVLNAKPLVKRLLKTCVRCIKVRPTLQKQLMGNLPACRVTPCSCFTYTGIDFCGPILIKLHNNRSRSLLKVYVAVFVCMTIKAVHLEIVSDLTTDAFIAALDRFISRRGRPHTIFSDNGTNFVGADRKLSQIVRDESVIKHCAGEGTQWKFNPPAAPHFGGMWESMVKMFKAHLRKSITTNVLHYEQLLTITTKIEAIMNSRPLYALNSNPESLSTLTPAHFLVGRELTALPENEIVDLHPVHRWEQVQKITQTFWSRWSRDYLHQLQHRSKWQFPHRNLEINDLVLVKADNIPSYRWNLGRVIELHPGKDDKIRVVTVKTTNGTFKRPVVDLAYIPIH